MEEQLTTLLTGQNSSVLLVVLAAGIAVLVKGADWLVDGAVGLSERVGVPKVIIGATVVSIGTTTPEAAVSVVAAFKGSSELALGNSVGSIICDTGMIFGFCALLTRLPMDRFILNRHGWIQFAAGVLLVLAALLFRNEAGQHELPRLVGVCFVVLLAIYLLVSVYWARQHSRHVVGTVEEIERHAHLPPEGGSVPRNLGMLAVGLVMVLIASEILVRDVQILCERWGVSPAIVSATVIAFGTSLPELVTALTSLKKGHKDLLIGNIIGADVLNVLFVTGAAACAAPLKVEPLFFRLHFPVMLAMLVIFRLMVFFGKQSFARWPGGVLLGLYVAYTVANYVWGTSQ